MLSLDFNWNPLQRDILRLGIEPIPSEFDIYVNLIYGPVRVGKSFSTVAAFLVDTLRYEGVQFGVAATAQKQIRNVLIEALYELGMPFKPRGEFIEIPSLGRRPNKLVTFPIKRSDGKFSIGGHTFAGALVDETVFCDKGAVDFLMERCSIPGAKIWLLTNPMSPSHWYYELMEQVWSGVVAGSVIGFSMDDAHHLTEGYKALLRARYKGADLQRRYHGLWVVGSTAVYPRVELNFLDGDPNVKVLGEPYKFDVSVDHADSSVTHALLHAYYPGDIGTSYVVDEWRHDAQEDGALDWIEQMEAIAERFHPWVKHTGYTTWVIDVAPAGLATIAGNWLYEHYGKWGGTVRVAYKTSIKQMVDVVELLLLQKKIMIGKRCYHLRKEMRNYEWDEKAMARGDDKPVKKDDHGPDSLRYYSCTMQADRLGIAA